MNLNHTELPFEVWCDSLEDTGIETEDLRLIFDTEVTDDCPFRPRHGYGTADKYGNGYGYGSDNGYRDGCAYGSDSAAGDGGAYGYEKQQ